MKFLSRLVAVLLVAGVFASPTVLAEIVLFDDFEYQADRDDPRAGTAFTSIGGWTGIKSQQTSGSGAGWLYTTTTIDGFSGSFPGQSSNRVLAIEARPNFFGYNQTDFYLQYGLEAGPANAIPGNVWFQFWLYPNRTAAEPSVMDEMKFLYMCNDFYPCHSHLWMMGMGTWSSIPLRESTTSIADAFMGAGKAAGVSTMTYTEAEAWDQGKLGHTSTAELIRANRWTLVKIHFDTTRTSGNSYEAWMRPYGGAWTKTASWIGGVTPGFEWTIPSSSVGGHRVMRMPTTVGRTSGGNDYWLYMDDFIMATTEADLPVYDDETSSVAPEAPTNVRLVVQ